MKLFHRTRGRQSEAGVALVLAIFTLMLISVIATSLILMAGMSAAVKTNYKTSMQAFYDAKAGLEEGRSRLSPLHVDATGTQDTINDCVFNSGNPMPLNKVCYIVNPDQSTGETVDPTDSSSPYSDAEWTTEFTGSPVPAPLINSDSPVASAGIGGPLYKWVRVTPTTEKSSGVDVDGDSSLNSGDPLYLGPDGLRPYTGVGFPNDGSTQVLSITALAMTPSSGYSGRRLLQYTVAQTPLLKALVPGITSTPMPPITQAFPAAVTMVGTNPASSWYDPAYSHNYFQMDGNDRSGPNAGSCSLSPLGTLPAIGVTGNPGAIQTTINNLRSGRNVNNYIGFGGSPSVIDVTNNLLSDEQDVSKLENVVKGLASVATEVVQGPSVTTLPDYGTPSNPVIAVIRGTSSCPDCAADFTLGGSNVGYGVLVVTGTLTVRDTAGWRGIVLVIGKGIVNGDSAAAGSEIDGTMLVAATRDASGDLLAAPGTPQIDWSSGRGGFYYDSCWITNVAAALPYQVLSFREIQQQ